MENKILKIFTFSLVTLTAFILIFKPELVRTMIPGIVEKIYVTINKIIPIERYEDLKPSIFIVAMIMPVFAGIMRSISDCNAGGIVVALFLPLAFIFACIISIYGIAVLMFLFEAPNLSVIILYAFSCYLIFSDSVEIGTGGGIGECGVGECY